MADPTIQTFCCHRTTECENNYNETAQPMLTIMSEFNTDVYNVICLFSSGLGILGALYQILPREQYSNNHRWLSFSAARGRRIIIWLALADLMASVGVFVRAAIWMNSKSIMPAINDESSVLFCALSSAWTQYFYTASWIWTLNYAIDMRRILSERSSPTFLYHSAAWITPAFTTFIGLLLLYHPDANCNSSKTFAMAVHRILPNYLATYIPMVIVMIANPCLYRSSSKDMERVITSCYCQLTGRERDIIDAIKVKFAIINLVFYICWIPNLINGFLLWSLWFHLPVRIIMTTWYIMAFTNPLQAFFNCMVYRRWSKGSEKVKMPWKDTKDNANLSNQDVGYGNEKSFRSSSSPKFYTKDYENYPLLKHSPRSSINGHKKYNA